MPIDTEIHPKTATPKTITPPKTTTAPKNVLYHTNWGRESTDPRPEENGTLLLKIQVYPSSATIDCREEEHVRNGEQVIFRNSSTEECNLAFDNNDPVFNQRQLFLSAGQEKKLSVGRNAKGWTHCSVDPLDPGKAIPKKFHSPPKIEVP